jgi:predicted Holliday junction resolvase-like endonuclease
MFRLSEARLFIGRPPRRTVVDELDVEERTLEAAVSRFEDKEDRIREAAREKGSLAARSRLRQIAKGFTTLRIDPNDVKVLFYPIQYVVFSGHSRSGCTRIQFIDRPPRSARGDRIMESLNKTIERGDVEWRVYRIDDKGGITVEKDK